MLRSNQSGPLHRPVISEAFRAAWHERRLWAFALFAGILQTAGIYDVVAASLRQMTQQISNASQTWLWSFGTPLGNEMFRDAFTSGETLQRLLVGGVLALLIVLCSLLSQGALVAGLHARARGRLIAWKNLVTIGFRHLWPVLLLNVITLGAIAIARTFVFIPFLYAARATSVWNVLGALVAFVVFVLAVIFFTSVHLFSLQVIINQNSHLLDALAKSILIFKKSWLIVIEKGLLLLVIGFGLLIVAFASFVILSFPWILLLLAGLLTHSVLLATLGWAILLLVFLAAVGLVGMFAITFQYGAWGGVYRRVAMSSASAKLHRFFRWLKEEFHLVHQPET